MLRPTQHQGDFVFKFTSPSMLPSGAELKDRIHAADWYSELDKSDLLKVEISLNKKESLELNLSDFPTDISLEWQSRPLFAGGLVEARMKSPTRLELSYRDKLYALERQVDGSHLKAQSLENVLKQISQKVNLSTRFYGDFFEELPAIFLGQRSLFENLAFLSETFGFFFYLHGPSKLLHFMRLGSNSSKATIGDLREITRLTPQWRSDLSWTSVETRVFDERSMDSQSKRIEGKSIYQSLSSLSEHAGYKKKQSWPYASGEYDVAAQNGTEFDDSERRVKHPLAKRAVFQESLLVSALSLLALPGDEVEISKSVGGALHQGKYLMHKCHAQFHSSLPRVEMTFIRP